jgi:hypothetical protein
VALAHDDVGARRYRMGMVAGLDLSPFNYLAGTYYQILVGSPRLKLCSNAADLFDFDFTSGGTHAVWQRCEDRRSLTVDGRHSR